MSRDIRDYSGLNLAYIGDAVYELMVRTYLAESENAQVNRMTHEASQLVNAGTQARLIEAVQDLLIEEEAAVCRRGRNSNIISKAKHATAADYRKATGCEALIGYLYLTGNTERAAYILSEGFRRLGLL
ncbi:MAG: ribonuclease III [Lachnospiraceae bacterium]|nr:ribonuclease III [Lachnospiraceae bacterium]